MSLTIVQRYNRDGIVKAGELIEIRGASALTLHDRWVYNLLIKNAGQSIGEDKTHYIPMSQLRSPRHRGGERVDESVKRLMDAKVEIRTKDRAGNPATGRSPLLADTTTTDEESKPNGEVSYSFTPRMREIFRNSSYWGRIKAEVMFAFSSKYSLQIYELLCLRGNLRRQEEIFLIDDLRALLGIPKGQLARAPDFLRRVIHPAELEINGLSDFNVSLEPIRIGGIERGKLTGFRVSWDKKTLDEWLKVSSELLQPKIGRRARLTKTVDNLA